MTDRELRDSLKKSEIHKQYLLISDEMLLIDSGIQAIKNALNVNESFDLEAFFLSEVTIEDIVSRMYLTPFASERRLLIIKNLEEVYDKDLKAFADALRGVRNNNCIVMTYRMQKAKRRYDYIYKRLSDTFPDARCVSFTPDQQRIHNWIIRKVKRDDLDLTSSMIHYLEDEFKNDITGLRNEFEKIQNYIYEAKRLSPEGIKDLSKGLCDFNKYLLVDEFFEGKAEVLERFEELKPYLHSYSEVVDALIRVLVRRLRAKNNKTRSNNAFIKDILDDIVAIDRRVKKSSYFSHLMLEIFLLTKINLFRKGVVYGREMA